MSTMVTKGEAENTLMGMRATFSSTGPIATSGVAERLSEQRTETGNRRRNNTKVAFCRGPDGYVCAIKDTVADAAAFCDVVDFYACSCRGTDLQLVATVRTFLGTHTRSRAP